MKDPSRDWTRHLSLASFQQLAELLCSIPNQAVPSAAWDTVHSICSLVFCISLRLFKGEAKAQRRYLFNLEATRYHSVTLLTCTHHDTAREGTRYPWKGNGMLSWNHSMCPAVDEYILGYSTRKKFVFFLPHLSSKFLPQGCRVWDEQRDLAMTEF